MQQMLYSATAKQICDVICSISAMLDGTVFSSEQLNVIERRLREAASRAAHPADVVRTTINLIIHHSRFCVF